MTTRRHRRGHGLTAPLRARHPGSALLRVALALTVWGLSASAPTAGDEHAVTLRSGRLGTPADNAGLPDRLLNDDASLRAGGLAVLKLQRGLTPSARRTAESRGVRFEAYLGSHAYLVRRATGLSEHDDTVPGTAWIAPYHPGLRIAPEIMAVTKHDPRPTIPVTIHITSDADATARAAELRSLGVRLGGVASGAARAKYVAERHGRIVALPAPAQLVTLRERISRWPETLWIGRRPAYRLLNDSSAWVMQSGLDGEQRTPLFDHGLYGEDQVIAVLDTGLDADMCYFRDDGRGLPPVNLGLGIGAPDPAQRKVLIVNFLAPGDDPADPTDWDSQDHGTHVAGSAVGDDLATPGRRDPGDGMAPAAKLIVQDGGFGTDDCADLPAIGCPAADLYPFFEQTYLQGARIHSNSYGDRENLSPSDIYSEGSQAADAFMWDHPDFLLLFSAGNGGPADSTIASPATAKNVLAVGAALPGLGAGQMASFSSRGPTADGRIKPDVIASGQGVVSADNDGDIGTHQCDTRSLSGTSMSCPTAAGMAALVRQYYTEGFYPGGRPHPGDARVPSAALLKATLIASAQAMEAEATPPPSTSQGWGRLLPDHALYFAGDARRTRVFDERAAFASADDPDHVHVFDVLEAPEDPEPLAVVLVWTDYPSNPAASINLVNDLNLELVSPTGIVYLGNVFSDGESQGDTGAADDRNNVEVIRMALPTPGLWTLRVRPHAIPQPAQGYALVVSGRLPAVGVALERLELTPLDTAGGNGDGVIDPGEWIDLPLVLLNSGDTGAANVSVTVSSPTAGVHVTLAGAALPDLAPNAQAQATPAPQIRLDPDYPCTQPLTLQFTYRSDGYGFSETLTLPTGVRQTLIADDFESPSGWQHVTGESTTTAGAWIVGDPDGTPFQPEDDATPGAGVNCLFTATNLGGVTAGDVDGGVVVARSGGYDLTGHPEARVRIARWFGNRDVGEDAGDVFQLAIRQDASSPDVVLEELGTDVNATLWNTVDFRVADHVAVGAAVELRVSVADAAPLGNVIEAALDDVIFWEPSCEVFVPPPSPPNPVADLRLLRQSGRSDDFVMTWSRPLVELDHAAATRYDIHGSTAPDAGFTLQGTLADASESLQFSHTSTTPTGSVEFYQVVSGNAAGDAEVLP